MEQQVLVESLRGTGAEKGRTKWKTEQVGAMGRDVCNLSFLGLLFCCCSRWSALTGNQKLVVT